MLKSARKQKPKKPPQDAFAPVTMQGKEALRVIAEHYELPIPPPLSERNKQVEFPQDLSEVADTDLGFLYGVFEARQNYVSFQATLVSNDIDVMERQLKGLIEEQIPRMQLGNITEKKIRARTAPPVRNLELQLEQRKNVYHLLEAVTANCERDVAAISREIARRSPQSRT